MKTKKQWEAKGIKIPTGKQIKMYPVRHAKGMKALIKRMTAK